MKQPKKLEDMIISEVVKLAQKKANLIYDKEYRESMSVFIFKEWATAIWIDTLLKELFPRKLDGKVKRMATLKGKVKA